MPKRIPQPTQPPRERAFLVGAELRGQKKFLSLENSLTELALLADTAGLEVVGELTQKLDHPNVETYIGPGKVAELKALSEETLSQVILFDDELSPRHQRELEETLGPNVRVLDRTGLILDIFAQHAHTAEGMVQVELAQYEYLLPRLTGQWTHLARQAGGGGGRAGSVGGVGLRGPGETQLEVDRRSIRSRIAHLKRELEKVRAHRMRYRSQRKRSRIPTIALVGYTNAGKSTLLNELTKSDVYVADQLFANSRSNHAPHRIIWRLSSLAYRYGRLYSKIADHTDCRISSNAGRNHRSRFAIACGGHLTSQRVKPISIGSENIGRDRRGTYPRRHSVK